MATRINRHANVNGQMSRPAALSLRGLTKRYDNGFLALDGLDLEVPDGAFFGLLGPNGAGKTTLISAVCNLIRVTAGELHVFGHDHATNDARALVGLAEQDVNLDRFLDVEETLLYHGGYYGMDRASSTSRPPASTSSCAWSCGPTSAACTARARRSC
jgi:ABC-2 type transport system ATP-binding protein